MMTFFICLFIVLMQFLWKSIDDLVGKGLDISVIAELFFYAALTFVPTALPLAVLLASLMVFGNLGENFELTAMKASGISLFRIMKPLIIFIAFVAVGAFFFQNNVFPVAQSKMWTLIFSVRQKTPEVEIPVRAFYDQIPNMNLYVEDKNSETGMLYDMIIYDLSRGLDNTRVILADSGQFNFTEDKTRMFLHLYSGEMFENMRDQSMGTGQARYLPFRREHFSEKEVYFPFDANFNRMEEGGIRSQYVGQNITQLRHSIDSIGKQVDSIANINATDVVNTRYFNLKRNPTKVVNGVMVDREPDAKPVNAHIDLDSLFNSPNPSSLRGYLNNALAKARRQKQEYTYRSLAITEQAKIMRRHDIEMQRKFTLSFACLIFFFIGAPLGAIIKKGGLGTPLVISVLLFIVYFIIDNMGYKMARDGKIPVWEGIWLSTAAMLPLGIFFTYKAVGDSAVFNLDAYRNFFRRLLGKYEARSLSLKEVRMTEVNPEVAQSMLANFESLLSEEEARYSKIHKWKWRFYPVNPKVKTDLNELVDYLSNSSDIYLINLLNQYPFQPRPRNIKTMIETTRGIEKRVEK
ncbi:MAG: YjgP/YjgQ family permease [Bacteroidales bacterium]|nr:YjgP/YjgQ family permease [Bacteroidales bacterium]